MPVLILLHRWLGVVFCLLFAMWFASAMVMHFVPFPELTTPDRLAGLAPIDTALVAHGPSAAIEASGLSGVTRVRLMERSDGPVYLVADATRAVALRAVDLTDAGVRARYLALAIATDYARRRHLDETRAVAADVAAYDQWTVAGDYDRYRPLYRVALNDSAKTELYVAGTTGEIVQETTRRQRVWNYAGSVAHWLYPTRLRRHPALWAGLVWGLSLLALIGASAGSVVGLLRIGLSRDGPVSPYRGLQAWHHWLGLGCMVFVFTFIFSGWLSMDSGLLFSTGRPTDDEAAAIAGVADAPLPADAESLSASAREVEWFAFAGRFFRRERDAADRQRLSQAAAKDDAVTTSRAWLNADDVDAAMSRLGRACTPAAVIKSDDDYPDISLTPDAPVFRAICGVDWFDIDGASGVVLEKLDPSRRAYRWLYRGLHTLDFPFLTARPALRATLIVILCGCGFIFSVTGIIIAWRRLRSCRVPQQS